MNTATNTPTPAALRELLSYNPDTGLLHWLKPVAKRIKVGAEAGCKGPLGYLVVGFKGAHYLAHRLAWAVHYGEWPAENLDTFEGNPANNASRNLRLATPAENNANRRKVRSDAGEGHAYPGVRYVGDTSPAMHWRVRHHMEGRSVVRHVETLLDAVALKMRLQMGAEAPQRRRKGQPLPRCAHA